MCLFQCPSSIEAGYWSRKTNYHETHITKVSGLFLSKLVCFIKASVWGFFVCVCVWGGGVIVNISWSTLRFPPNFIANQIDHQSRLRILNMIFSHKLYYIVILKIPIYKVIIFLYIFIKSSSSQVLKNDKTFQFS